MQISRRQLLASTAAAVSSYSFWRFKKLRQANYQVYISLEMEGKEIPESAVAKSLDVMRAAFA